MDLIPNSFCCLCDENTSVLSKKAVQPFLTTAGKIFFNADENGFKQGDLLITAVCSLCVQKISACTKFKNSFEAIKKRNGPKKTRSCHVCEKKKLDLIKTFDDPNDIIAKFTLFTKYSSNKICYEDCEICLDCLFYISLWCELHNILIKRLNIDGQALKSFQRSNHTASNFSDKAQKKDKENVTPPHNNILSNKKLRTASTEKNSKNLPKPNKQLFKQSRRSKLSLNRLSRDFSSFLSKELKNVKCLQDGVLDELNCPDSVLSDKKMLRQIPYVLISQKDLEKNSNSQERKSLRSNKAMEIIDIVDSEDEPVKRTTRVSFQLPPKEILPYSTNAEEETNITCNICDEIFFTTCDYKLHRLWHEKPEQCKINLVRSELPKQVKSSEFGVDKSFTEKTSEKKLVVDINYVISKYITSAIENQDSEETSEAMDLSNKDESKCVEVNNISYPNISDNNFDPIDNTNQNSDKAVNESENETLAQNTDICVSTLEHTPYNADTEKDEVEVEEGTENNKCTLENNNSTENVDDSDGNCESDVERALAQLHDEVLKDVERGSDKEEDSDNRGEISDDKGDAVSDDYDEDNSLKRKRADSPVSSDDESSNDGMPKIKKVRFAIDYSYAKLTEQAAKSQVDENILSNSEEPTPLDEIDN